MPASQQYYKDQFMGDFFSFSNALFTWEKHLQP